MRLAVLLALSTMGMVTSLPVPAASSPVAASDLAVAEAFAASVSRDGKIADITPFASDVTVEVLLRNPMKHDFVQKFFGSGVSALSLQTANLFALVGRPQGTQCETAAAGVICQFAYPTPENGWIAIIEFKNGKIGRVTYMYLTKADLQSFQAGG